MSSPLQPQPPPPPALQMLQMLMGHWVGQVAAAIARFEYPRPSRGRAPIVGRFGARCRRSSANAATVVARRHVGWPRRRNSTGDLRRDTARRHVAQGYARIAARSGGCGTGARTLAGLGPPLRSGPDRAEPVARGTGHEPLAGLRQSARRRRLLRPRDEQLVRHRGCGNTAGLRFLAIHQDRRRRRQRGRDAGGGVAGCAGRTRRPVRSARDRRTRARQSESGTASAIAWP